MWALHSAQQDQWSESYVFSNSKIWLIYVCYITSGSEHGDEDQFDKDAKLKPTGDNPLSKSNALNDDDVFATAFVIMVAGYDTTGRNVHDPLHLYL